MTDSLPRFEELLGRYHDELYRYLWRLLDGARQGLHIEPDDLLQETFERAYRAYPRLRPDSNPRAWLYKIATNCALTALKRHQPSDSLEAHAEWLPDVLSALPHREVAYQEMVDALRSAVLELPPTQRAALVMRYLQGLEYAEISAALECSEESARSNVSHAVRRLRRVLSPDLLVEME